MLRILSSKDINPYYFGVCKVLLTGSKKINTFRILAMDCLCDFYSLCKLNGANVPYHILL